MIDHSYLIITREVQQTNRKLIFAAKIRCLYIVVDGLRIDNQYPNKEHFGNTQVEAMVSVIDALRSWLSVESAKRSLVRSRVERWENEGGSIVYDSE